MLAATCARTALSGRPESASNTRVSRRANASTGPLAWIVDIDPSCPVLSAWSMSSASPARTSGIRRPSLEADDVGLREAQLGRLLDGDDAIGVRDRLRERVQQRGLAGAGRPRHQEIPPRGDGPAHEPRRGSLDPELLQRDRAR